MDDQQLRVIADALLSSPGDWMNITQVNLDGAESIRGEDLRRALEDVAGCTHGSRFEAVLDVFDATSLVMKARYLAPRSRAEKAHQPLGAMLYDAYTP